MRHPQKSFKPSRFHANNNPNPANKILSFPRNYQKIREYYLNLQAFFLAKCQNSPQPSTLAYYSQTIPRFNQNWRKSAPQREKPPNVTDINLIYRFFLSAPPPKLPFCYRELSYKFHPISCCLPAPSPVIHRFWVEHNAEIAEFVYYINREKPLPPQKFFSKRACIVFRSMVLYIHGHKTSKCDTKRYRGLGKRQNALWRTKSALKTHLRGAWQIASACRATH
jgi:hypothetical protein